MKYIGKSFSTYRWHSINLIPNVALVMTYDEDDRGVTREGTLLELVLFGQVFHINIPIKLDRGWESPVWGPLWSRRRRVWYRAPK